MAVIASQLIGKVGLEGSEKTLSGLKQIGEHTEKAESSFKKLREQVARGFEFGTGMQLAQIPGSIFDFFKEQAVDIVKAGADQQAIMQQTIQALKSTHDASGMTAASINDLADAFAKTTRFSDDTTQSAENLLLTFTNIGKNTFPAATKAVLDLSQAMGQDTKESAIQLGKALNDPLTGMSALQRVGVTFDETQKKLIKTYMDHNQIAKAQGVILKELSKEFGGSAEAAGKGFAGALQIAENRLDQIKEKIGTALLPILGEFLGYFEAHLLPRLDDFAQWFQKDGIPKITEFGQWFKTDGIPMLTHFGDQVGIVAGDLVNFVKWMQQGTPPALALKDAAIALGIAIATVKIGSIVSDMASFIGAVPQMVAKMLLVQNAAKGIAGAEGLEAITPAAAGAEKAMATAATGMKLSLAGVLSAVGLVAGAEMGLAMWLHDSGIVPDVNKITGGHDTNPGWITHKRPPGMASGVTNFEGGLAYVHKDELLVNMPRGTNVIPASVASGGQGGYLSATLVLDGVQFARVIAPYTTNHMRYSVGSIGW